MTHGHVEFVGKSGTGIATKRMSEITKRLGKTGSALGTARKERRELFGKGALSTGGVLAEEPPHAQQQTNCVVADRQIARSAQIAAMHA